MSYHPAHMGNSLRFLMLGFFAVILQTGAASAQDSLGRIKLVSLPDQTKLVIPQDLELSNTSYDERTVYHVHFDNGAADYSTDITTMGYSFDSGVTLRTNSSEARVTRNGDEFLSAGTYCLSKSESYFETHTGKWGSMTDYLYFRTCDSNEPAFVLYLNAGYTLRNSETFHGYTLGDFKDQVGKSMRFSK